jgi:S-adenosylmethionine hydrolase
MPVLEGFQAVRPASSFVSWDTDASPQSGTFHTRDRYAQPAIRMESEMEGLDKKRAFEQRICKCFAA